MQGADDAITHLRQHLGHPLCTPLGADRAFGVAGVEAAAVRVRVAEQKDPAAPHGGQSERPRRSACCVPIGPRTPASPPRLVAYDSVFCVPVCHVEQHMAGLRGEATKATEGVSCAAYLVRNQ